MARLSFRRLFRILILTLLILVPLLPVFLWYAQDEHALSVFIMTKTVPEIDRREHKSLFWLLNHFKIIKPGTLSNYDPLRDYYGYFPESRTFSNQDSLDGSQYDLIYLADAYGVFSNDPGITGHEDHASRKFAEGKLMYGGISPREAEQICLADSLGIPIIGESNILGGPTDEQKSVSGPIESVFGVHYTGQWGKYFERLQEVPEWMKNQFETEYKALWGFSGWGIVIIDEGMHSIGHNGKIIVLDRNDLNDPPVIITRRTDFMMENVKDHIPYYAGFEVLRCDSSTKIMAAFNIRCSSSGLQKLGQKGMSTTFPAVLAKDSLYRNLYFAGDFADNDVSTVLVKYWGVEKIFSFMYYFYFVPDQSRFYWRFYLPLMKNIVQRKQIASNRGHLEDTR